MLINLPNKQHIMLIAHNANYDCRFILQYLTRENPLVKGNRVLTCDGIFYRYGDIKQKNNIKIKDSLKMINMPLRKFGESFNLSLEKDIMPYKIYTEENIEKTYVSISLAKIYIKNDDEAQFENNIDKWNCRGENENKDKFDIIKYSSKYCEIDCSVLRQGYEKFREWRLEYTELDIDDYITLQSL